MATHRTVKIPFDRLVKVGIWSNQKARATMATIYSQLQAKYPGKEVYIINGGFFDMNSFKAIFDLKADNVTYSEQFTMAYMGMNTNKIQFDYGRANGAKYTDLVSAYPILIEKGKKSPNFEKLDNAQRGRSMLGYNNTHLIISCIADVADTSDFSMEEELNFMLSQGCIYAINLDGGGSSQCNFNGAKITSSRKVNNFVYAIVTPEVAKETVTTTTSYSVGSVIKLKNGAKWSNGKAIPTWVFKSTLYCRSINNNGTITVSTQKTGATTGTVSIAYVEGTTSSSVINTPNPVTETATGYKVKVTATVLNIRAGAGTNTKKVGNLKQNQVVTIIDTKNGWGKLSDGKGWISLYYTKRI